MLSVKLSFGDARSHCAAHPSKIQELGPCQLCNAHSVSRTDRLGSAHYKSVESVCDPKGGGSALPACFSVWSASMSRCTHGKGGFLH